MGLGSLLDRLRGGSGPSEAEAEVNRFAEGSLPADVYITTIGVCVCVCVEGCACVGG